MIQKNNILLLNVNAGHTGHWYADCGALRCTCRLDLVSTDWWLFWHFPGIPVFESFRFLISAKKEGTGKLGSEFFMDWLVTFVTNYNNSTETVVTAVTLMDKIIMNRAKQVFRFQTFSIFNVFPIILCLS